MQKTGIAEIFAASLELTKEGILLFHKKKCLINYWSKCKMKIKKNNIIDFPSSPSKIERQVEAILFAASEPLDIETIEKRIQTSVNLKKY